MEDYDTDIWLCSCRPFLSGLGDSQFSAGLSFHVVQSVGLLCWSQDSGNLGRVSFHI